MIVQFLIFIVIIINNMGAVIRRNDKDNDGNSKNTPKNIEVGYWTLVM